MASTYTANSGIEKPGSGEQSGTWGTTTNTNFDIIDRVLSGVGAITLSGTTHTLSTSDGASSDGHYRVLVLGGSPSGTNTVTITPNDQDKVYLVHNNTSQSAVFTQGSGSNETVAAGAFAWIFADGAGASAAVTKMTVDTASIEDSSITSAKIANGTIATADIADDAVTSAKIADTTIVAGNIANNTITATQIAADAVGASELADDAVDTAAIADSAVTSAKIADSAVTSAKISDGTIVAGDLANGAVTSAKILDGTIVNGDISGSAAIAFSKMANLTASRALVSDGNGDVSVSAVTSTELGYLDGVTSNVQTQLNSVSVMPNNIVFKTSGSGTISLPAGTEAVLIKAAGGGGGGGTRGPGGGNTAYSGSAGGDSTVTLASPSIAVTAKGGGGGNGDGSYNGPFSTGDSGGAVYVGQGGKGGAQDGNFDITGNEGRSGNLVQTYVKDSGLGGKSLSYSVGGGGASSGVDSAQAGAAGFVEVWYW